MKHKLLYLVLLLCLPLSAWADYASNVRVRQHNKDIIVTYDLSKTSNVQLLVSTDNGSFSLVTPSSSIGAEWQNWKLK